MSVQGEIDGQEKTPDSGSPTKPGILVVDDEPAVLTLICMALRRKGYRVLGSTSAPEAQQHMECGEPIHLLITDFSLPGQGGMGVAAEFRKLRPNAPVLIASGAPIYDELPEGFSILLKPFSPALLCEEVQLALLANSVWSANGNAKIQGNGA